MSKSCSSTLRCGRCSWQCWKFTGSPGNALLTSSVVYQAQGKTRHFTTRNSHGMQTQSLLSDGRGYVLVKNPFRSHVRKYTQDSVFQGLLLCVFINGCQFRRCNLVPHVIYQNFKKN